MEFENLEVWKRSSRLSANIYKELSKLKDYSFRDQITRSGLSIPSNIAEGFERGSQKECVVFLSYAKGSSGELPGCCKNGGCCRSEAARVKPY